MTSDFSAIALTGTIGAGKTTVAKAISEVLHERNIRHALLDLDWLGQVYPVPEGHEPYGYALALQNLKHIWPNFQAAGADKDIVAGTILTQDQRDRLQNALGGIPLAMVLVRAPEELLNSRIRFRNSGQILQDFLARAADVAQEIETAGIHDFEVENHDRPTRDVARDLLLKLGWTSRY